MNSKVAYVVVKIYYFNMWLCMKRKSEWGKKRE